jgi:hypothetical protein
MLEQIENGSDHRKKDASKQLLRQRSSETVFLFHVVVRTMEHVHDLVARETVRAAAIETEMLRVGEQVNIGLALWNALDNENFFSSRSPKRRQRREDTASLIKVLTLGSKDSKHWDSLQRCRVGICKLLSEVHATIGVTERLTVRYFPGLKILFKSDADALNDLATGLTLLVNYYNGLADDLAADELGTTFDTGFTGRLEKIDRDAAELAAKEGSAVLMKGLITLVRADTLWFFNDRHAAAEVLRPLLSAEEGKMPELSI